VSTSPNASPYKGSESYQIEDSELFFGRDAEASRLLSRILSSRFTLLHAQSGAGKTSLLNARIIPRLETSGWSAVRVIPQNHPTESVRVTTLHNVLPSPASEAAALARAWQFLDEDGDPALGELLHKYDRVPVSDPRRRDLLAPVEAPGVGVLPPAGRVRPLFLRVLRGTLPVSEYRQHLNAILQAGGGAPIPMPGEGDPMSRWRDALADPELRGAHEDALAGLYGPDPDLRLFFDNLFHSYAAFAPRFSMVMILDQFEELFTRFVDAPSGTGAAQPDWRLRWEFLGQLERLAADRAMATGVSGGSSHAAPLPLRIVISMRDEYIAQLDPVRRFVPDLDACAFHLSFLEKKEAQAAIVEPARRFAVSIDGQSLRNIAAELTREDRYVEPAQLQIVCEKLWDEYAAAAGSDRVIQVERGKTRSILGSFFKEFLDSIAPPGSDDRLESLEILDPLVTAGRTRNIVERECLIHVPYRDPKRRERLLKRMMQRMVVRVETRLGGRFAEITHEFLIGPVLDAIRSELNGNAEYARFRWALRTLERFEDVDLHDPRQPLLDSSGFQALHQHRKQVVWTGTSAELMFRSAIRLGQRPETLLEWAGRFAASGDAAPVVGILAAERIQDPARATLSLEELSALWRERDGLALDFEQAEFLFRNALLRENRREHLEYWTRRFIEQCRATR
jgi:hypothetical protein